MYIFAGRHLLAAKLRSADKDAADGARDEVARIVAQIREGWPDVRIILRADSGFARGEIENRIKECQADLFAGRTSAASMRANQLRLWFAAFAYVVLAALTYEALWRAVGDICSLFEPRECWNFLRHAGYASD